MIFNMHALSTVDGYIRRLLSYLKAIRCDIVVINREIWQERKTFRFNNMNILFLLNFLNPFRSEVVSCMHVINSIDYRISVHFLISHIIAGIGSIENADKTQYLSDMTNI